MSAPSLPDVREQWDGVSAGWAHWLDAFERGGSVVTARLMRLAGLRPGQRGLDVGTGLGEPALTMARAVGPTGRVIGIDVSGEMVKRACERARGLTNLELVESDVAAFRPRIRFDAVLARWSLMFSPDRIATLQTARRLLRPGGVLAAAVWGKPPEAPIVSLAFPVLTERLLLPPPPPDQPGPYAMSDPHRCASELIAAGFTDVSVTSLAAPFWMSNPAEYARFARDVLPVRFRRMLHERFGSAADPDTWAAVERRAAARTGAGGRVDLTSTVLCLRGRAPHDPVQDGR
jgi:enediyne biosynthesis protein CalE5